MVTFFGYEITYNSAAITRFTRIKSTVRSRGAASTTLLRERRSFRTLLAQLVELGKNLCALLRGAKEGKKKEARRRAAAGVMNQLSDSVGFLLTPSVARGMTRAAGRLTVSQLDESTSRRLGSAANRHRPRCLAGSIAAAPKRRSVTHNTHHVAGMLI